MAKTANRSTTSRAATPAKQQGDETRALKEANRRAAAKVYVKASEKIGEPVPQIVRDLAAGHENYRASHVLHVRGGA